MNQSDAVQAFYIPPEEVRRVFSVAAPRYDESAVLARAIREQLLERLDLVRLDPGVILEAGVATGASLVALRERYPGAALLAADIADGMLAHARGSPDAPDRVLYLNADCHQLPLASASVDLVFCNLMLPWCHDPETVLGEFRRVLRPDGLVSLATFGPDTLKELRAAWDRGDGHTHVHYFYDMHDIGDALQRAGFAGPVMDVDYYTLTYARAIDVMRDLKTIGSQNLTAGRARGLTGRQRFARVVSAYEKWRTEGRLPATYEVIFGHAWAPVRAPQTRLADGAVAIPADGIGRTVRDS